MQTKLRKCLLPFKSRSFVLPSILRSATTEFAIFICRFIRIFSWALLIEQYTPSTFMHKHGVLEHAWTSEGQNNRKILGPFETSVTTDRTQCNIPEDLKIYEHHWARTTQPKNKKSINLYRYNLWRLYRFICTYSYSVHAPVEHDTHHSKNTQCRLWISWWPFSVYFIFNCELKWPQ